MTYFPPSEPRRCIFLTRAYLLTSEEPGVACAAAMVRDARGPAQHRALDVLRRRIAAVLQRDIAAGLATV